MRHVHYDVVPYRGGYAIVIVPDEAEVYATKHDAFDAAADLAHKLRFIGVSLQVRVDHGQNGRLPRAKAS